MEPEKPKAEVEVGAAVRVDEALVRHVAGLARLDLRDDEVASMVRELSRILHHVEAVSEVDVAGVDPASAAGVPFQALREDVPAEGLRREDLLKNSPEHDEVFLLVPKVLGD